MHKILIIFTTTIQISIIVQRDEHIFYRNHTSIGNRSGPPPHLLRSAQHESTTARYQHNRGSFGVLKHNQLE